MNLSDLKIGDVGIIKRPDTFWVNALSLALKVILAPWWQREGWHMFNIAWYEPDTGWVIQEAAGGVGARTTPLSTYKGSTIRFYRWFTISPTEEGMKLFAKDVKGYPYDNFVYFLTIMYHIIHKFSFGKIHIPRLMDKKLMCWEDVELCDTTFGRDWEDDDGEAHAYPLITDFIKHAEYLGEMTL